MKKSVLTAKKEILPNLAEPERGAPAALKAIEHHEVEARVEKDRARTEWHEARSQVIEGDDVLERRERRLHNEYRDALETWEDATKKLALFDKGVAAERREGEKILVEEAREIFRQYSLSLDLALEGAIIASSQSAALCDNAADFCAAAAGNWRAALAGALSSAHREGVLPKWLL